MAELSTDLARYAGLGLQFALTLVLCGALGWWLDSVCGTQPWLLVAGVLAGGIVAFLALLRAVPSAKGRRADSPPNDRPA
jgi:F0F1-type ATP synthase assembly protein I